MQQIDMFYDTTKDKDLKTRQQKSGTQSDRVLNYFRLPSYYGFPLTPDFVHRLYNRDYAEVPLTSIRRAITNLTKSNFLVKTDIKRMGSYGMETYCWKTI